MLKIFDPLLDRHVSFHKMDKRPRYVLGTQGMCKNEIGELFWLVTTIYIASTTDYLKTIMWENHLFFATISKSSFKKFESSF